MLPFLAYAFMFLFLPAGQVLVGAFKDLHGGWTTANISGLFKQPYIGAYENSIELSAVTAAAGAILGLGLAYAAIREGTPRWIRSMLTTFSGVAANFGGIPLAFAFIATIGGIGIVTKFFANQLHYNIYLHGFSLFTKTGVEIVYLYFQLPLMVLVISPAIDGLKREWREAAANLGAHPLQFWRYIGFPVLMPSILGTFILLFGNAFAAYATAYSLGYGNLITVALGAYYQGNVLSNPHFAQAMALGMFVVLLVMMTLYIPLNRRAARWAK